MKFLRVSDGLIIVFMSLSSCILSLFTKEKKFKIRQQILTLKISMKIQISGGGNSIFLRYIILLIRLCKIIDGSDV